jgi:hypothetical protein
VTREPSWNVAPAAISKRHRRRSVPIPTSAWRRVNTSCALNVVSLGPALFG